MVLAGVTHLEAALAPSAGLHTSLRMLVHNWALRGTAPDSGVAMTLGGWVDGDGC